MTRATITPLRGGWPIARTAPSTIPALNRDQSAEIDRMIARMQAARANGRQPPSSPVTPVTGAQLAIGGHPRDGRADRHRCPGDHPPDGDDLT